MNRRARLSPWHGPTMWHGRPARDRALIRLACTVAAIIMSVASYTLADEPAPAKPPINTGPALTDRPNLVRGDEITEQQQAAVEKGLAWLATRQDKRTGAFGAPNSGYGAHSGITSLAGIAFMSAGNLPGRGKYGENVKHAVDFVLRSAQPSGLLSSDQAHGVMYSHGFATLFLAEVYGMSPDPEVKEKLQKAVQLIEKCQNREGGWRYMPVPFDADISVTICQVMGLRAARDAGIKVEKSVIDKAIKYVQRCRNPDGGFSYMANTGGGGGSGFERTAAGVASLYDAGGLEAVDIQDGLKYMMNYLPGKGGPQLSHYHYGHYYAVQAMFLAGGEYWAKWYPAIREELLARQDKRTGVWSGEVSEDYCTAIALIVLQMPNRYLPVFSGKGAGN